MLHSLKPEDFVPPQNLNSLWKCADCQTEFVFGNGKVFLTHYQDLREKVIKLGLMCFCSMECGLNYEHHGFMGKA